MLEAFDGVMSAVLGAIVTLIGTAPHEFSSQAFGLTAALGSAFTDVGIGLYVLFFSIDLTASTISLKAKNKEEMFRLLLMFLLGAILIQASFPLALYIFSQFQGMTSDLANALNTGPDMSASFESFTENVREMIEERSGARYVLDNTANMVLFFILIMFFLSMFGLLLSVLLVPIVMFLELFAYSAFSPLPLSTLCTSQRAIAISFLKAYVSVCIRALVIIFSLHLSMAILSENSIIGGIFEGIVLDGILLLLVPVMQILISIMIIKSGITGAERFSRTIVGMGG